MLNEKVQYIAGYLGEAVTAQHWLVRLLEFVDNNLTFFPMKYPVYRCEKYGDRYRMVSFRNDIIIYEIDEEKQVVYVDFVCTKGRNLNHLTDLGL